MLRPRSVIFITNKNQLKHLVIKAEFLIDGRMYSFEPKIVFTCIPYSPFGPRAPGGPTSPCK